MKIVSVIAGAIILAMVAAGCSEDPAASTANKRTYAPTKAPSPTASSSTAVTPKSDSPKKARNKVQRAKKRVKKPGKRYRVLRVVDGDTVHIAYRGDSTVRIIGIDTPETVHPNKPVECGGPAASRAASRLLMGKKVQLVFDKSQGRTDRYGRLLAYLRVPKIGDYGLWMINHGRAVEYTYASAYQRQAKYRSAQSQAQGASRGLWGSCGGPGKPQRKKAAPAPKPRSSTRCADGYKPCLPVRGDLNCGDISPGKKPIRVTGSDQYRLDRDGDGWGCDT